MASSSSRRPALPTRRTQSEPGHSAGLRRHSLQDAGSSSRIAAKERVLVRVYDLGQMAFTRSFYNNIAKSYGAFHTGVQVYGREWSFGMTFDEWSSGITWCIPGQNSDHSFRETLSMGYTDLTSQEVEAVIYAMKDEWKGSTYNVLSRNCHNFSDELCWRLCGCGLPPWVNALASTGDETVEFMDSADSGYDGGAALFEFFSDVRRTLSSVFTSEDQPERRQEDQASPRAQGPRRRQWRRRRRTRQDDAVGRRFTAGTSLSSGSSSSDPFGVPSARHNVPPAQMK